MNKRHTAFILIIVFVTVVTAWFGYVLRKSNSDFGYISRRLGLAPDETTSEVLRTMHVYVCHKRYDLAIDAGVNWTTEHPIDGSNDQVFLAISFTYLERARRDKQNGDAYLSQAILYRDKAIPTASDRALGWYSIGTLRDMALVSEAAGDLSEKQRCVQYRNALKLYKLIGERLNDKRDEISRRTPPKDEFGVSLNEADQRIHQALDTTERLEKKIQSGSCE